MWKHQAIYKNDEKDKFDMIETLEKMGIHHINGVPLKDAIIVSDHLNPGMIEESL